VVIETIHDANHFTMVEREKDPRAYLLHQKGDRTSCFSEDFFFGTKVYFL
jgi:hypothetical protein